MHMLALGTPVRPMETLHHKPDAPLHDLLSGRALKMRMPALRTPGRPSEAQKPCA